MKTSNLKRASNVLMVEWHVARVPCVTVTTLQHAHRYRQGMSNVNLQVITLISTHTEINYKLGEQLKARQSGIT